MSYEEALAELKEDFGKKKLLTPADIAPFIGKSVQAQANLRHRKRFPLAKVVEGRVVVSIYDLARYLSDPPQDEKESAEETKSKTPRAAKAKASTENSKPTRRPPSLGKTLLYLRKSVQDLELQARFQNALFAELEAYCLDKSSNRIVK